jgi:hypothetical protein
VTGAEIRRRMSAVQHERNLRGEFD